MTSEKILSPTKGGGIVPGAPGCITRAAFLALPLLLLAAVCAAQTLPVPPNGAGGRTGNADNSGGTISSEKPPGVFIAECTKPSPAQTTPGHIIAVTVNPATRWQPRGGEVLVALTGDATQLATVTVKACFGWSTAGAKDMFTTTQLADTFKAEAFVQLRPSDRSGLVNLGVIVPWDLDDAAISISDRLSSAGRAFAFGIIPTVSMRLIGYNKDGILFDVVKPVGITTLALAVPFTTALLGGACILLFRLSRTPALVIQESRWRSLFRLRWVLRLIRGEDGRASLSSFQVLLWTFVVVAGAIFVMSLSGELINIPSGTLTLLGIAGGAKIIARTQGDAPGPELLAPAWSDLLCPEGSALADVARMQMLFFTLVSAAFVALQVVTTYVIPEIPAGYQILMGISNGVYVGAKLAKPQ